MILYYLSFVIDFKLSLNQKQDFLFFEGVNDSAHLFRQNSTILLNVNNELYKTDIRGDKVTFNGYEIIKRNFENCCRCYKQLSDGEVNI